MQKSGTPLSFETGPALQPEATTQPRGPLEQGDQALVDAMHAVPEGSDRTGTGENGVRIHMTREKGFTHDIVTAKTTRGNGVVKTHDGVIEMTPNHSHIGAHIEEGLVGDRRLFPNVVASVSRNMVGKDIVGGLPFQRTEDRTKAQEIKLEVARKISQAQRGLDGANDTAGK